MDTALEELADTAEAVAQDQQQIARAARRMQRQRDQGWSWSRILDHGGPSAVELVRRSGRRVAALTAGLSRLLARGLDEEGASRRQIARRLGVTHQRVSAILGGGRARSN